MVRALLDDPERVVQLDVAGRMLPDPEAKATLESWSTVDDDRGRLAALTLKYFELAQSDPGSDGATSKGVEET